jgi:hypothetical protein
MFKSEILDSPEQISESSFCRKAIELYLRGRSEYSKAKISEILEEDIQSKITEDADCLAEGKDGVRYGAPGWGDAKLRYDDSFGDGKKVFYIDSNGMDEKKFKNWQEFIGKKFEKNGLNFFYF